MRPTRAAILVLLAGAVLAVLLMIVPDVGDEDQPPVATDGVPLSDAAAAARVRPAPAEPRPDNARATRRTPTEAELERYRLDRALAVPMRPERFDRRVTGAYRGSTDEILQWGAAKWGFPPDLFRAAAAVESFWRQDTVGDHGESFGLLQVRGPVHAGTDPLARLSVAFNVDYYGATLRHYVDGCARWLNRKERGATYEAGDVWGSIGAWYAGRWRTDGAERYIAKVQQRYAERPWTRPGFAERRR